jgi:hypothetical protein
MDPESSLPCSQKLALNTEVLCNTVTRGILASPQVGTGGPHPLGYPRLFVQYTYTYLPCMSESSHRHPQGEGTCHAVATRDPRYVGACHWDAAFGTLVRHLHKPGSKTLSMLYCGVQNCCYATTRAVSGHRLGKHVPVARQQILNTATGGLQQWKSCVFYVVSAGML